MKINRPFYLFYDAYDICMCHNTKCKKRFDCLRFMGKPTNEYYSMADFPNECDSYIPYIVWVASGNRGLTLKQISNDHLKNIIIHLFERLNFNGGEDNLAILIKEFIKEAKRRKIYK